MIVAPRLTNPIADALRACKTHFVMAAVLSALLNLLYLAPTIYMLQVYDRVVSTRGKATLLFLTVIFLFAIGTLSLLDLVRSRLLVRASVRLDKRLSSDLLDAAMARRTGSRKALSKQAMREFDTLRQTMTGPGILSLFDAPWTPIYVIVSFMIHWELGLLALGGGIILVILTLLNERATKSRLQKANEAANVAYVSQEYTAAGADVIRALGMRRDIVARHLHERHSASQLQTEASFAAGGYVALTRFFRLALQSLALGCGAYLAIDQKISAGAIFAASLLVSRALAPIEQMLGAWRSVEQARNAWRVLSDLLVRSEAEPTRTHMPAPTGAIEVEHLIVMQPGRETPVLRGVSFGAAKGEVIGVIGPSGGGKSTLMRVIAGAAGHDRGVVRFDGAARSDWDPERLGRHIGFMPQDIALFAGTVKENIARFQTEEAGSQEAIDAKVIEAAKLCGAHDMIVRLPLGYDTPLEWGGRGLSAGQSQAVALARAVYGEPKLLLLDEPNAHLDSEGELALLKAIKDLKERGATILIVAHRPGVLAAIDKLMVMREGQVEMFGPRDEILKRMQPERPPVAAPANAQRPRFAVHL